VCLEGAVLSVLVLVLVLLMLFGARGDFVVDDRLVIIS
jgi:hypothetical protein